MRFIPTKFNLSIILLAAFLLTHVSCIRKNSENSNTVSIEIPSQLLHQLKNNQSSKVSSFANSKIARIAINITGPGIPSAIVYSWDRNDFCKYSSAGRDCSASTAPTSVDLEVDMGDSRLIQLLLVVEDSDTKAKDFLYADQLTNIYGTPPSVVLAPTSIGTSNGAEAKIVARYINSSGVGPTGPVSGYFNPSNGRQPMKVLDSYMWGGWTEMLVLDGASFTYILDASKEAILEKATLAQFNNLTASHLARIHIPNFCRWDGNSTHSYSCDYRNGTLGEDIIFGFFGPNSAGKTAYYINSATGISNAYASCTNTSGVTSCTGAISYSSTAATNTIYPVGSGGVGTNSTSSCSSADLGTSCLMADVSKIAQMGKDGVFGFRGPFVYGTNGFVEATQTATAYPVTLSWKLLPGTYGQTNSIDGVDVFYTNTILYKDSLRSGNNDAYNCESLPKLGFTKYTGTISGALGATQSAVLTNTEIANINRYQMTAVICPYTNNFNGKAIWYHPTTAGLFNDNSYSSPSTSSMTTTTLAAMNPSYLEIQNMFSTSAPTAIAGNNSCSGPFTINRRLGNGSLDTSGSSATINLVLSNPGAGITTYANSEDCIKNLNPLNISNLVIPGGSYNIQSLYFKSNNVSTTHTITAQSASYNSASINLNVSSSSGSFVVFGLDVTPPNNQFSSTFSHTFTSSDDSGFGYMPTLMSPSSIAYAMVRFTNSSPGAGISNLYASNNSDPYYMFGGGFPGGAGTSTSFQSLTNGQFCSAKLEIHSPTGSGAFTSKIYVSWRDDFNSQLSYSVDLTYYR